MLFCSPLPSPYILRSPRPRPRPSPGAEQPARGGLPPPPPPAPPDPVPLRGPPPSLGPLPVQVCFLDSPHHLSLLLMPQVANSLPCTPRRPSPSGPRGLARPSPAVRVSCDGPRDRSQDHRLPSEVPAALPVLLPGTFELFSALPKSPPRARTAARAAAAAGVGSHSLATPVRALPRSATGLPSPFSWCCLRGPSPSSCTTGQPAEPVHGGGRLQSAPSGGPHTRPRLGSWPRPPRSLPPGPALLLRRRTHAPPAPPRRASARGAAAGPS